MTVDEALIFFSDEKNVAEAIQPLAQVGLGYVKLGQSSSTLSGGEAQRVKLASFLGKGGDSNHVFFIFDEPTTGLHFHDIGKLLQSFNALIERGHTVLIIEHNMEVIKCADYIIDLGPKAAMKAATSFCRYTRRDGQKNKITNIRISEGKVKIKLTASSAIADQSLRSTLQKNNNHRALLFSPR